MTIFALFYCIVGTNVCQMYGAPRVTFAGPTPAITFSSLKQCAQFGQRVSGHVLFAENGKYPMPNGSWFECRSRHVDTWQSSR